MPPLVDRTGERFGRLTVLYRSTNTAAGRPRWLCVCDCGREIQVAAAALPNGNTKSCGCLHVETARENGKRATIHGHYGVALYPGRKSRGSPEYMSWRAMIQRCTDPHAIGYARYGAVGITVCLRWRESFVNFLADMGTRPPGTSLDRIDSYGNYEPSNCRWATRMQQRHNRRGKRGLIKSGVEVAGMRW